MKTSAAALYASIVRTIVPTVVGAVLTWLVARGVQLDAEFAAAFETLLFAAFTAIWYIAVRLLETYVSPIFGYLLGLAKEPVVYENRGKHAATE